MKHDHWKITLEAYLDGELSVAETGAFEELASGDPVVRAELEARRNLRNRIGNALTAIDPAILTPEHRSHWGPVVHRKRVWIPVALAACLALAILTPRVLHNVGGTEGSRLTLAGQVSAVRYGEIPGHTVVLETGSLELPAAFSR